MKTISANWNAPGNIGAVTTTRIGGHSKVPYDGFNLGLHVGDEKATVHENRNRLKEHLSLPNEPDWLNQTHSNHVVIVEEDTERTADATITRAPQHVLAIMTADCLPILLCDRAGTEIAAIHAGWKGLANGIIEQTIKKMQKQPSELVAWIGPAICGGCYEVGDEFVEAFNQAYPAYEQCFIKKARWYADLPKLAQMILVEDGIIDVSQSEVCTFEDEERYYSYRRDGESGRIATLIWFRG
jgi:polyphenol oxidase